MGSARIIRNNMPKLRWIPIDEVIPLHPEALHLWRLSLQSHTEVAAHLWEVLSEDEQQRAQRFVRSQDQHKFVCVRGTLRCLLGQYLHTSGRGLRFDYGDYGKPQLVSSGRSLELQFNVSHSHDLALIAITQGAAVGVDIEHVNLQTSYLNISQRFFSSAEHDVLLQQPLEQQCYTFFQLWTRKEACVKAMGGSIAHGLDQINVAIGLDQPMAEIYMMTTPQQPCPLFLQNLSLGHHYAGAVATTQSIQQLYTWDWHDPGLD